MTRADLILRIQAVFTTGYSSPELFQEETGYPFDDLPPVIPDVVDKWARARWQHPGRRPELLRAVEESR